MNHPYWLYCSTAIVFSSISMNCTAVVLQEKLAKLSEEQNNHNIVAGTQSGGLSLSSLSALLEGGNTTLSANTMENAAGVIEYCTRNKLSSMANAEKIQGKLVYKLGLTHSRNTAAKKDYAQGLSGLLNTHNGQQLDMKDLSHSELAAEVKTKACDLVLKQGMDYLSFNG